MLLFEQADFLLAFLHATKSVLGHFNIMTLTERCYWLYLSTCCLGILTRERVKVVREILTWIHVKPAEKLSLWLNSNLSAYKLMLTNHAIYTHCNIYHRRWWLSARQLLWQFRLWLWRGNPVYEPRTTSSSQLSWQFSAPSMPVGQLSFALSRPSYLQ